MTAVRTMACMLCIAFAVTSICLVPSTAEGAGVVSIHKTGASGQRYAWTPGTC